MKIGLLVFLGLYLAYFLYTEVRKQLRLQRLSRKPILLYHKPTGKLITMPGRYEHLAITQMLADLDSLPGHVTLDSPEFQVIAQ
jgi:hypothetical protein